MSQSKPVFDPLFNVKEHAIFVAGAAGGLAAPLVRMLAARGARLMLADIDESGLAALGAEVAARTDCGTVLCDITSEDSNAAALEETRTHFGRLDAVVNAAGVLPIAPAAEMPAEVFRHCLEVNLTGALLLSRAAAPLMQEAGGSIVHIASVSSSVANPGYTAYASSKAALAQLVRVLAREWAADRIRVNAIGPALTETPLSAGYLRDEDFRQKALGVIPMGRFGEPEDLFAPVLMLLGPGGRFITGQTIYPDGGRTLV